MSRWSNLVPLNDSEAIDAISRGWNPPGDDDLEGARVDRAINRAHSPFGKLVKEIEADPACGPLPAATDAAVAGHEAAVSKVAGPWPGVQPAGAAAVRGQLLLSATVLAQRVRDLTRLAGEVGDGPGVAKEVAAVRAGLLEQAAVLGAIEAAGGKGVRP